MSGLQKFVLGSLALIAGLLIGVVLHVGMQMYGTWAQQPLGPGLSMPTSNTWSLPPTWTPSPPAGATVAAAATPATPIGEPTLAVAGQVAISQAYAPHCGGPAVMNLLAVGSDQRGDSYVYGLGDVIRLVRVDFVTPKVTVLEFPRDLWVEIPDIADDLGGQDHEKLNQAYLYGNRGFGYTDDPAQGPGLLARTLGLNFGVKLDHYVGVNMRTFVNIVNAVDGIDIYLAKGVDGRTADDNSKRLVFPRGQNHLNGDEALTLARIRNDGVFSRADHQDLVLCALREKLTRPAVGTQIPQLIGSFQDNIQTDLSPQEITQLACLGPQIQAQNIIFASFPQDYFRSARIYDPVFKKRVFIWDVDYGILRDYVARFQAGTWPATMPPVPASGEEPSIICQ